MVEDDARRLVILFSHAGMVMRLNQRLDILYCCVFFRQGKIKVILTGEFVDPDLILQIIV